MKQKQTFKDEAITLLYTVSLACFLHILTVLITSGGHIILEYSPLATITSKDFHPTL